MRKDPQERFWAKVNKTDTCWLWTGADNGRGYGKFKLPDILAPVLAHRFSYESLVGPIPDGLHLDHLCRNPPCVNPAHLEPVTPRVNQLRGETLGARNAAKTHCVNGHEFTPENTGPYPGNGRTCRQCCREKERAKRARLTGVCEWTMWGRSARTGCKCGRGLGRCVLITHPQAPMASESKILRVCATHKKIALRSGWFVIDIKQAAEALVAK